MAWKCGGKLSLSITHPQGVRCAVQVVALVIVISIHAPAKGAIGASGILVFTGLLGAISLTDLNKIPISNSKIQNVKKLLKIGVFKIANILGFLVELVVSEGSNDQ